MAGLCLALAAAAAAAPLSVERPDQLTKIRMPGLIVTYEGTSSRFPAALDLSSPDEASADQLISQLQEQAPDTDFSVLRDGVWVSVIWYPPEDRLLDRSVALTAGETTFVDFAELLESALQATQGPEERPLLNVSIGGSVQPVNPQVRIPDGARSARELLKQIDVLAPTDAIPSRREAEHEASLQWFLRDNGERQGLVLTVVDQTPRPVPDEGWAPWDGAPEVSRRAFLEQIIAMERATLSEQTAEGRALSLERIQAWEAELERLDASE